MSDYRPIIDQVAEALGVPGEYGKIVPRLTAVLEMAELWERKSRQQIKPEWQHGYHPDYILFDMPRRKIE